MARCLCAIGLLLVSACSAPTQTRDTGPYLGGAAGTHRAVLE